LAVGGEDCTGAQHAAEEGAVAREGGPSEGGVGEGVTETREAPATPFAAAGPEFESTEPTQLEFLERLPSDLLADGPAESLNSAASLVRTARGVDRSTSKVSLSRFAPDAWLALTVYFT